MEITKLFDLNGKTKREPCEMKVETCTEFNIKSKCLRTLPAAVPSSVNFVQNLVGEISQAHPITWMNLRNWVRTKQCENGLTNTHIHNLFTQYFGMSV